MVKCVLVGAKLVTVFKLDPPLLDIRKTTKGKGRNFRTKEEGAGMTAKGVAAYKRKNPGSGGSSLNTVTSFAPTKTHFTKSNFTN